MSYLRLKASDRVVRKLKVILILVALAMAGILGLFAYEMHEEALLIGPDMAFDARLWKATELGGMNTTRMRMENDLLRKQPLVGMTRRDVIALLGPPDPEYAPNGTMVYWLGPGGGPFGFGIDSTFLEVRLTNDRVVAVRETSG
ncbi:MAG TPA: hypothetical protein VGM51_10070 [Armatimonadota bacterium]|jgi:hypothetical protein